MYDFYNKKWAGHRLPQKILLIMKLTTFILLTVILQVSAKTFAQKISLSEKNSPLVKVLRQIRVQSGYDIMFTEATLKGAKNVTIQVKNAEIKDVLDQVFDKQPLAYVI